VTLIVVTFDGNRLRRKTRPVARGVAKTRESCHAVRGRHKATRGKAVAGRGI
jgi:hypothetical protein